jgi:hypothetical protein
MRFIYYIVNLIAFVPTLEVWLDRQGRDCCGVQRTIWIQAQVLTDDGSDGTEVS